MGTVADKLTYLGETKQQIRAEANRLLSAQGKAEIAGTDAFRAYADKLATVETGAGGSGAQGMPRPSYLSPTVDSPSTTSATLTLPEDIAAGDAIVIFGLRRSALNPMPGWIELPAPDMASYQQWTYAYYKIADGTEGGVDVSVAYQQGTHRLNISALVIKPSGVNGTVSVNHIASVRENTGESKKLTAPDGLSDHHLTAVFYSRVYTSINNDTYSHVELRDGDAYLIREQSPRILARSSGEARSNTALMLGTPFHQSVGLDTDTTSADESISAIWVEFLP